MSTIDTRLIDGKQHAATLTARISAEVARLDREHGLVPGLAVVLVGHDAASEVYVRNKTRQTSSVGMRSFAHSLPAETTQADLLALVARLNADPDVHGILVQLPLPPGIDSTLVLDAIDPAKDVDGLGQVNVGRVTLGHPGLVPCTPLGCLMLLIAELGSLRGLHAVVVGRSNLVGRPMSQLLLNADCTVTTAHIHTVDTASYARRGDILVVATGRPGLVRGDWIKPGATVIDVGITRIPTAAGKTRLIGDVVFDEALGIAGRITPVPGGVGPMTIACLLSNTLYAARRQWGHRDAGTRAA
ncbi:bifunctional methylenetetrahydrofolate dehydrogenase/methenyltetrahydrofolate cyclohydrolase FolD [Lichenicoccus sp.]|uniref:bifunctional methylenetetrahydrofolate dehydrogenase/methenyltetrahydrofolate cyclohydrolase FolD n=1 Tax=Lichenicoccus sp. TaxID=2781899 RepID=UPI003D0AFDC6